MSTTPVNQNPPSVAAQFVNGMSSDNSSSMATTAKKDFDDVKAKAAWLNEKANANGGKLSQEETKALYDNIESYRQAMAKLNSDTANLMQSGNAEDQKAAKALQDQGLAQFKQMRADLAKIQGTDGFAAQLDAIDGNVGNHTEEAAFTKQVQSLIDQGNAMATKFNPSAGGDGLVTGGTASVYDQMTPAQQALYNQWSPAQRATFLSLPPSEQTKWLNPGSI